MHANGGECYVFYEQLVLGLRIFSTSANLDFEGAFCQDVGCFAEIRTTI